MAPLEPRASRADETLNDLIVAACPDGLWILDDDGRTTFANERMAQLLGVEHEALVGHSVFDSLGESGAADFRAHLALLRDDPEQGAELRCCLHGSDGHEVWATVTSTPMRARSGEFHGWLHRVTDQSLAVEFERRQQQFAESQQIAGIGSWDWDFVNSRVTWSDELYEIYGVDPNFVPSIDSFLERVHPDDMEKVVSSIGEEDFGNTTFAYDYRFVPEGGKAVWIRSRGMVWRDDSGKVTRMGGTSQDISATKEIENAIAFLSVMGRAANESHSLEQVLVAADEFVRPFAQWPGVVIGVPVSPDSNELMHIDVDWSEITHEQRALGIDLANRVAIERRILTDGRPGEPVLFGGPVIAGGRLACVLVTDTRSTSGPSQSDIDFFDQILTLLAHVAEREWAAEELATARDEALRASTAKSEFLATMSHEIRTPLNGVIGLSELLSSTDLTTYQRRLATGVDQAGRTLLAIVNDILDLSKIEAGRLDLEEVDFDPRTIIEQSAALVADQAREKQLELVVSSAGNVPGLVRGDPVRFGQVITNLLSNAVKFTSRGEVVLRATGAHGRHLRVEVSDTGLGIAPEVAERLFQAFSQGDTSTTREYGGTGLGLAISKRIVTAMGGEIGLESDVSVGTTFWFTVDLGTPLHEEPKRDLLRETAVDGLQVLVVDDNETNRFVLEEKLTAWGINATSVESAHDALIELDAATDRGTPYDVGLLDYMMPGVDGAQLARMIRAEARHDRTRLALLSSAMEPSEEFLHAAGIDAFLGKPVLPALLLDAVARLGGRLAADHQRPEPAPDPVADGIRGRILVVEDNPVNQLVAEGVLRRIGYSVVMSDNGATGLAAFAADQQGYDAILMDCQMPVMNGYDATHAIRAMQSIGRRIPIIAMTANAAPEERQRCLNAGMDDFLLKPVDRALLESTLARWIVGSNDRGVDHGPGQTEQSPVPAAAADVVLDRGRLTELLDTGSADLALVHRIVDRFAERVVDALDEMAHAVETADAPALVRVAHSLRGGAGNVGLVRLAGLCESFELRAGEGELPGVGELLALGTEATDGVTQLQDLALELTRSRTTAGLAVREASIHPVG